VIYQRKNIMKLTKTLGSLVAAALGSAAIAQYSSPELMLVADGGDAAHPPQVERYDPYTGAYLGAFGAGYFQGAPDGISIIGQDAYVTDLFEIGSTDYSRIDKFNFSTGAYDGSVFNPGPDQLISTCTYGGNLILGDYGGGGGTGIIWTLTPTGGLVSETHLPTNVVADSTAIVGNQLWVAAKNNAGTSETLIYNLNADGSINGSPTGIGAQGSYLSIVTTTVNGTQYVYTGGYDTSVSNGVIDKWTTSGAFAGEQTIPGNFYGAISLAAGHNGIIYALNEANGIARYDGGSSFGYGSLGGFTLSNTVTAENIAVYAAPEPVSMAFLGLGVVGLIARRRRRS
jgi:hypothetical protein